MFKENKGEVLHGILLIVLFSFSAFYIAEFEFVKQLSGQSENSVASNKPMHTVLLI